MQIAYNTDWHKRAPNNWYFGNDNIGNSRVVVYK